FEVTKDVSQYIRAALFQPVVKTDMLARFFNRRRRALIHPREIRTMRIEENSRPAAAPASASTSQTLRPSLHAPVVRAGGNRRGVIRAVSVFLLSVAMAGAEPARAAGPPANVD